MKVAKHETCSGTISCAVKQLRCYVSVQKWVTGWKVPLRPFCGII